MPELTDTELIATRLLGWCEISDEGYLEGKRYSHTDTGEQIFIGGPLDKSGWGEAGERSAWPDLTNWNDIQRMDDALTQGLGCFTGSGALRLYMQQLIDLTEEPTYFWIAATAAQRVAAAVNVIQEAERVK